jgi:PadR family transcriptional regulator, regulatory protein PadR
MKGNILGELEELVLLTIAVLDQEAYGVAVTQEIEQQTGRVVDFSSVHTTLKRLQEKGFLRSEMGGATPERGGRRKRLYTITTAGFQAIREVQQTRSRLWEQIPNKIQWKAI